MVTIPTRYHSYEAGPLFTSALDVAARSLQLDVPEDELAAPLAAEIGEPVPGEDALGAEEAEAAADQGSEVSSRYGRGGLPGQTA